MILALLLFYSAADKATVTDLCNDHPETLNAVCLKLDDKRGPINWYHLGMKLGISGGTLRTFRDPSGCSPSEVILQKIATLRPNISTTTIAATVEQEVPAVAKVLNELSGMKHSLQHSLLASLNNTLFLKVPFISCLEFYRGTQRFILVDICVWKTLIASMLLSFQSLFLW